MELPIEDCDYFIRVVNLPSGIYALLLLNDDGTYSLYFDSKRDRLTWIDDYTHELWHMVRDDIYSDKTIREVENL